MFTLITRSLKIKLSLFSAFVFLIIFFLASIFLINQTILFQKSSLINRAQTFADLATKPLGEAYNLYGSSGYLKLNDIFQKTLKLDSTIPRIQVISVNGDVLYDTNEMQVGDSSSTTFKDVHVVSPILLQAVQSSTQTQIKNVAGDVAEIIVPYADDFGIRPFSMRYFLSYNSIDTIVNQAIRTTVILTILLFLLTFIALMLLVNTSVLTPLEKLTMLAKAIGQGDFDYKISIKTGDELEQLANTYHSMAQNLKDEKAAILAEKDTLSLVLGNIADGVIALDAWYTVLFLNKAATQILGLDSQTTKGKTLDQFLSLSERDKTITVKQLCEQSGEKISFHSLSFYTFHNEQKKIHVIIAPLQHPAESEIRYIVTFYDLTKEEEFEKMKLDFVSMAAHELRTPLTSIRGYLSMLKDALAPKISSLELDFLQRIQVSAEQLYYLVQNLLNISNIEQGKMNLQVAEVDLEKLAESIVSALEPYAKQQNIQLTFEKPEQPLPHVMADNFRINEVLSNLISNAINYNRKNGWIKVGLRQTEGQIVVFVQDSGMGIAESALAHLFTKFYRVSTPLEMGSKGTGLGLYISKKIIDAHQGKIWVESELNKGTTFSFSLAVAQRKN